MHNYTFITEMTVVFVYGERKMGHIAKSVVSNLLRLYVGSASCPCFWLLHSRNCQKWKEVVLYVVGIFFFLVNKQKFKNKC